ncbi:hypothetical protein [uncultured Roseobacter sp.]|uniref:hypothetical protein n=1 Tax=uncultured Roseobacter sp. TaxID=114847 RepID=UPI00261B8BC5|nr:hypothetical protein [uncultured Roseobacter sp.]
MRKLLFPVFLVLAGCATSKPLPQSEVKALVDACLEETQATGVYSVFPGGASSNPEGALPRARAVENLGGTKSGADAVNACIRRRALA